MNFGQESYSAYIGDSFMDGPVDGRILAIMGG